MTSFFYGFSDEILKIASDRKASIGEIFGIKLVGDWSDAELLELKKILSALPSRLVKDNPGLLSIGRAPKIINAPPGAPGHSMYKPNHPSQGKYRGTLVIFDKGVYDRNNKIDSELFGKSVLHELSHSFDGALPEIFGRPPFVTEYASRSPKEDWAESFAEFFLNPDVLRQKAPGKSKAIASFVGGKR